MKAVLTVAALITALLASGYAAPDDIPSDVVDLSGASESLSTLHWDFCVNS